MDINSINNNISTLNTSSSLHLEKASSSKSINKINIKEEVDRWLKLC